MSETHYSIRMNPHLRKRLNLASEVVGRKSSELVREAVETKCNEILEGQPLSVDLKDYIGALASEKPGNARRSREVMEEILDEKRRQRRI